MKTSKDVIIMTPASLQMNYIVELKKCGDNLYKKNQYWEFISLTEESEIKEFSKLLHIDVADIRKKKGVWMVNSSIKDANYDQLSNEKKKSLDEQIDRMIKKKYKFIAYNGIRWDSLNELTQQYSINPFDNKIVIIDEAHHFVSRIVNKLEREKEHKSDMDNTNVLENIKKVKQSQTEYNEKNKLINAIKDELKEANNEMTLLKQSNQDEKQKSENIKKMNIKINEIDKRLKEQKNKTDEFKAKKNKNKYMLGSLFYRLYEYLMNANNCKIILLTGTPIINYPNEIAVLFNILRGKIKTWNFKLANIQKSYSNKDFDLNLSNFIKNDSSSSSSMTRARSENNESIYDFLNYNKNAQSLTVTRNPFGFVKSVDENGNYKGMHLSESGNITDDQFVENIVSLLKERMGINVGEIKMEAYKALPDKKDNFSKYFMNNNNSIKNEFLFKRRIIGLTSYFRSAQESLMPAYENSKNLHIMKIEMSDHQLGIYNQARMAERDQERKNHINSNKDDLFGENQTSTYRIFSRAFCNFVFPKEIKRPLPKVQDDNETIADAISKNTKNDISEDAFDGVSVEEKESMEDSMYDQDDIEEEKEKEEGELFEEEVNSIKKGTVKEKTYLQRIAIAMRQLSSKDKTGKSVNLSSDKLVNYSPKFLKMLEILNKNTDSLHLIYTQFRTLEGIGILKLVLEANGYVQFKTKIDPQTKEVVLDLEMKQDENGKYKLTKPTFVLYTGTETKQEKELIRNIYNGNWKYVPESLAKQMKSIADNNMYGDIIKIFMITASGAEGISLKNVRYVHITEPYWHPVRMAQVIGRARRICSHQDLPKELRTVDVFLYLMKLSEEQKKNGPIELKMSDNNETSDETLYNMATKKEEITESILHAVKESAIDCAIHKKDGDDLKCFSFVSSSDTNKLTYVPSIENESNDQEFKQNVKEDTVKIKIYTSTGSKGNKVKFYINEVTNDIYDPESYNEFKKLNDISKLKIIGKKTEVSFEIFKKPKPTTTSSSSSVSSSSSSSSSLAM
jgi:hypothetical protein